MSFLLKLIGIGFAVCLVNPLLKKESPHTAAAVTVGASVIIFSSVIKLASEAVMKLQHLGNLFNLNGSHLEIIIKTVLIAWVCEYCGSVIADAGENALAKKIELAGKTVIFIMIFPLVVSLAENAVSFVR